MQGLKRSGLDLRCRLKCRTGFKALGIGIGGCKVGLKVMQVLKISGVEK